MSRPTITAHSGCEGTPDGSMAAILRGIELGADIVEVDVRRVRGLGLALTHDVVGDAAGLVTLEQAFKELARHPGTGVNCDLKEYGLARDVMAMADSCGLAEGSLAFSGSLTPSQLERDPEILRRARVYLNIEEALCERYRAAHGGEAVPGAPWDVVMNRIGVDLESYIEPLIDTCLSLGVRALNLPPRPFIQPYLLRLGGAGVRLSCWTINEPEPMRRLLSMPFVENLTTRKVELALSVRGSLMAQR